MPNPLENWSDFHCGLIYYIGDDRRRFPVPVPLRKVNLNIKVVDFIAEIVVEQEYVNREDRPIEVVYSFPVEESGAVTGFEANIDGRDLVAEVKEKEKAKREYEQAIQVLILDCENIISLHKYKYAASHHSDKQK